MVRLYDSRRPLWVDSGISPSYHLIGSSCGHTGRSTRIFGNQNLNGSYCRKQPFKRLQKSRYEGLKTATSGRLRIGRLGLARGPLSHPPKIHEIFPVRQKIRFNKVTIAEHSTDQA